MEATETYFSPNLLAVDGDGNIYIGLQEISSGVRRIFSSESAIIFPRQSQYMTGLQLVTASILGIGATLSVTSAGSLVIDANQAGNADYSAAPQVQKTIVVSPPQSVPSGSSDFTINARPPSQSVVLGAAATYTGAVASSGGAFTNAVALSLSGAPAGASVSFSPTSITPGSAGGSSTLTVTPAASSVGQLQPGVWPLATPALALLILIPFRRWRKAWKGKLLLTAVGLASLAGALSLMGCGGGFALTPKPQTYTLTLT